MSVIADYCIESPVGRIRLCGNDTVLTQVTFDDDPKRGSGRATDLLRAAAVQLQEYFKGVRTSFDAVPLALESASFTKHVWEHMRGIPFGTIMTYKGVASILGNPNAVRAVGSACRKNPFIIIVPCHRIIPSSFETGNYAGGREKKELLQAHEEHIARDAWLAEHD